ncbi:acetyl/propionyl-CoA carboxylase subuit alpha [Aureimonas sp. Leaf454]|uniref:acetyl-CoA carboxylase biotin carboxylase subunit n=1 Tax=Aureimonas sp. Leaf454 TaxID=1736381 RepID=UPI0006F31416|nr:acetyl/propionyl/methylcrotonyl-CoA carboxylase subunit alpha [Aureimonas sp. Leaf454]KQT48679.1 acetyl/propionyl-CoA carboxylase subuit alpha [Aureimonas sp. Leaf454]
MFQKILIANRGEIACRVIRTARRMGIRTVAVYSDADRGAEHVRQADEALRIGPSPASESYLRPEAILEACRATGAEAVHPGYGFLSERAAFCELLEANGITFIGPKPKAIRAMGDKIESKLFAKAAGVSIVPGHLGIVEDADEAVRIAEIVGYPVMIKASAGGGGKGMRIAAGPDECRDGFERARSEARSSFGDDRVFIERFIVDPRHIEIQVLADSHGNAVHLGERECSIQRRNQKVVEEAPSPFLDAATRAAMGAEAIALAKAVDYESAGTVEFIVDRDRNFFFLEMNTRLQVEHPVTELVTGIDIVEEMIRIAAGEPLRLRQDEVKLDGWAVESRIYAEDPFRGFLPSTGRLTRYRPPVEGMIADATVRNDTGVAEGSEISIFYDPMIAKLCTHAKTRGAAIEAMTSALDRFEIAGIQHNIPFLSALMAHPRWREGRLSTGFIAEEFPGGFEKPVPDAELRRDAAIVAATIEAARQRWLEGHGDRLRPPSTPRSRTLEIDVAGHSVLAISDDARQTVSIDERAASVGTNYRWGQGAWEGDIDGRAVFARVRVSGPTVTLSIAGQEIATRTLSPALSALGRLMPVKVPPDTSKLLLCPMPGLVVSMSVSAGAEVKAGETLVVIEAMKMENVLRAERDLVIESIEVAVGQSLAVDAVIMRFQ